RSTSRTMTSYSRRSRAGARHQEFLPARLAAHATAARHSTATNTRHTYISCAISLGTNPTPSRLTEAPTTILRITGLRMLVFPHSVVPARFLLEAGEELGRDEPLALRRAHDAPALVEVAPRVEVERGQRPIGIALAAARGRPELGGLLVVGDRGVEQLLLGFEAPSAAVGVGEPNLAPPVVQPPDLLEVLDGRGQVFPLRAPQPAHVVGVLEVRVPLDGA